MTLLLDVNVLIALIDPAHVHHNTADIWFASLQNPTWATCPITENAVMRIVGRTSYRNSPGGPAKVAELLKAACRLSGHVFWPDMVSFLTHPLLRPGHILTPGQITDIYLLALARSYGGQLATFDRRLPADAIEDGSQSLLLIPH